MKIQKGETPKEERKGKEQHHMLPKGLGNETDSKPGWIRPVGQNQQVWLPEGIKGRGDTETRTCK